MFDDMIMIMTDRTFLINYDQHKTNEKSRNALTEFRKIEEDYVMTYR